MGNDIKEQIETAVKLAVHEQRLTNIENYLTEIRQDRKQMKLAVYIQMLATLSAIIGFTMMKIFGL